MAAKVQVFKDSELMDVAAAEAEELGQAETIPTEPDSTAAAPESAPGESTAEAPQPAQPERTADQRVPYSRYAEAVKERNELRERWARLDERQKQAKEARDAAEQQQQAAKAAAERPDPAVDPVGAQLYDITKQNAELLARQQQYEQQFNQLSQGYQQNQQEAQFNNWVVAEANNYARSQPDYFDAAQHAANWRIGFWQQLGLPDEQARQLVMAESNLLAKIAQQTGKQFAPIVYNLAKSVGYQPRGMVQNGNGNGAAQPTSQAASQAGRVLSQVAKGQAMQGLSRAGGTEAGGKSRYATMSAADISAVSDGQWQRDWANPQLRPEMEAALRRLDGLDPDDDVRYFNR